MHSFTDDKGKKWTACSECNRGGNGNDKEKCSSGWQCRSWNGSGCYLGLQIVGEIIPAKVTTRSQQRYKRFLEYGEGFEFIEYCYWDAQPERSWNNINWSRE